MRSLLLLPLLLSFSLPAIAHNEANTDLKKATGATDCPPNWYLDCNSMTCEFMFIDPFDCK